MQKIELFGNSGLDGGRKERGSKDNSSIVFWNNLLEQTLLHTNAYFLVIQKIATVQLARTLIVSD